MNYQETSSLSSNWTIVLIVASISQRLPQSAGLRKISRFDTTLIYF